jgi:HSP20 family protein
MESKELVPMNGTTQTNLPSTRREEGAYLSPYREMNRWMSQWDQWFDQMWNRMTGLNSFAGWSQRPDLGTGLTGPGSYVPALNVTETENEFKVTAELPGLEPGDIELTLNRGSLTISGEKQQEHEETERGYHRVERSYGRFQRSVQLPEGVDGEKIEAGFKNGVLTVTVPKLPDLQESKKRIQIKSENK